MNAPTQTLARFRADRQPLWERLETLLNLAQRRGPRALSEDELIELPVLYRATLSSLSVARDTSLDASLIAYLEALSARAYFFVYGARANLAERAAKFFLADWPRAARALGRETIVSFLLLAGGALIGYLLVARDPSWFSAFVPPSMAEGRDPSATTALLRHTLYDPPPATETGLGAFATFLFTHNAQIAFLVFALGFALGVPTILLMIQTGAMGGALVAVYVQHGLGVGIGGWLLVHGTTELFAITLASAAGLSIARAVAFPGQLSRRNSVARAGRMAGVLMTGVTIMLVVAGLLEGFARQLVREDLARYAIAGAMLGLWLVYLYVPRPRTRPR